MQQTLMDKIAALPTERVAELEDFVDFLSLRDRDRTLRAAVTNMSAPSFEAVWENPEDDVYDEL